MDAYKGVVEVIGILTDYGMTIPDNPYDARNLEEAISDFLERFFDDAYSEGQESEENYHYDRGYDSGYDNGREAGYEEGYDDAVSAVRSALDL